MSEAQRRVPPVTDELRAQAAKQRGGWVYAIDPYFDPADAVPPHGIIGAWEVQSGRLSKEFRHNHNYRPSPQSLGLPDPSDPVEAALQLAATGYGSEAALAEVLLEATVYLVASDERGATTYTDDDGLFVPVFTDPKHTPTSSARLQRIQLRALLPLLPSETTVRLNPLSTVSGRVPVADLRAAAGDPHLSALKKIWVKLQRPE
ncbi:type VII secretion system-associated protein [Streptomyces decoyicus]|uniref:type VII secretion system-associated protein n=1 Tax=Streptomyces decoyicus TaxID=249567 RepID=UPI002E171FD6|nr:type VII secretion system-associated protein [Streptomyces decoyicus]